MKLPTWQEARDNVQLGLATTLELFIFEYEPFEDADAVVWRNELIKALDYYAKSTNGNQTTVNSDEGQLVLSLEQDE